MGGANTFDIVDCFRIPQHQATAAIDLQIDQSRCENAVTKIDSLYANGHLIGRKKASHLAIFDKQGSIRMDFLTIENPAAEIGGCGGHTVWVTFFRCLGTSGLNPRCRANHSMKA